MKSRTISIIIGLLIILIGVGYGLAALGIIDHFSIFFKGWWTVFIILPGIFMLFSSDTNKFASLCVITIGVVLLLQQNDLLGSIKKFVIPALIILFGVSIILSALVGKRKVKTFIPEIPQDGSIPKFEASFGEFKPDYSGKEFEGCSMDITFGSGTLDLRQAIISKEVTISINTAFSGVDVYLPAGCRVDLQTSASFGGVENKYIPTETPDAPLVHIYVAVSFGGVEIQ